MKFSLSWLRTHLDTDADAAAIAAVLNTIGLEVEGIEDRGAALAAFRIGRVVEAVQHPNADRLRACRVDIGDGTIRSVVCGAPNARTGMLAVVALPGAFIPGTGVTLKIGDIRGVKSEAMMLSAREMGLGDDHAGIVDLPEDAPIGVAYPVWAGLSDPVIEISVTPNRGDALSIRGIARDLAAAGLGALKPWSAPPVPAAFASPLQWAIDAPHACHLVLGRALRGLTNGPSPQWLQDRLTALGLRPISRLVDVTNFFTFDLGRPLHVFDVQKVRGGVLTLRMGRDGESFAALNGRDVLVTQHDLVIADEAGAASLAGIIGGQNSGCDEHTTEAFIECALFDPVGIARSGRRHGIATDARARFERGLDPELLGDAVEAATRMMLDLCGGEASEVVSAGTRPHWRRSATLRFERLAGLGGLDVAPDLACARLAALGFGIEHRDARKVTVAVPSWRNDVASDASAYRVMAQALDPAPGLDAQKAAIGVFDIESECDLVEEVLRLGGLDAVPAVSLPVASAVPPAAVTPRQARTALARRVLAARGALDSVTFGFMAREQAALFGAVPDSLRLLNPIASDLDQMRPTPVATLVLAAARNAARGIPAVALSEVGGGWRTPLPDGQLTIAACVRTGETQRHWDTPARGLDWLDAKGDALAVLAALGVPAAALSVSADAPGFYHPGRSGVVRQGPKTVLATFGALHPRLLAGLDIAGPAVACEVFLDAIPDPKRRKRGAPDLPDLQTVRRDFAFLVDTGVAADAVLRAARGADRVLIAEVALFDRYAGERLPEGKVSLAIEVTLQPRDKTLTEAEIEAVAQKIVAAVGKATGAVLR